MGTAPELETKRLRLVPLGLRHWEDYARAWADPATTRFIGGTPRDRTTSWTKFIAAAGLWPVCGFGYWVFEDRQTGAYRGCGGLARFERGIAELESAPEAGWALAPDAWGQGIATEAMAAALEWADTVLRAAEVRCIIDPDNAASHRVAAKLGFERIGHNATAIGPVHIYRRCAGAA